jgi:hypothetical protein
MHADQTQLANGVQRDASTCGLRWTADCKSAVYRPEETLTDSLDFALGDNGIPLLKKQGYEAIWTDATCGYGFPLEKTPRLAFACSGILVTVSLTYQQQNSGNRAPKPFS